MKSPYQKTKIKLDQVFALFIRQRDTENGVGKCSSCGKLVSYRESDAGHFINRRWMSTRWREDNVHLQCRGCNRFDEGNAAGYALFMLEKYGKEHVEYLRGISHEPMKYTIPDMEFLITDYKQRLHA